MTKYLSRMGLRARLIILVFIPIVPALLLLLHTASEQKRTGEITMREETFLTVKLASNNVEQLMEGAHQVLSVLSELPAVQNRDSAVCNAYFAGIRDRLPMYSNLLAATSDGDIFCSALPLREQINVADRLWFRNAIQRRNFSIGRYMIGRISGKPVINAGFPAFDRDGHLKAIVSISVDLHWFGGLMDRIETPKGATLFIMDHEGTVLAHYPDPEKWVGRNMSGTGIVKTILTQKEGTVETSGLSGKKRIFSFTPVKGTDGAMYICTGISPDVAFAGIYRTLLKNMAGLFIIAFIASTAAWFGGEFFIIRRMQKLARATDELAGGNLAARVDVTHNDEIDQLGSGFNKMAAALEKSISEQNKTGDALRSSVAALAEEIDQRRLTEAELKRSHEQLQNLAAHLQSIRDEERTRISRELHDELGQVLTALKFDMAWIAGRVAHDNPELMEKVKSDSDLIDSTIQILKRICAELRPSMLDHFGLGAAIQWQAKQWEERSGISCLLVQEPEDIDADKDISAALYGIFREALTNVRRHANATNVTVNLRDEKDRITMEIHDNGIGISEEQLSKPHSFGLLGMRERVYPWKGEVMIAGLPGRGTTITVTIPKHGNKIPPPENHAK